MTPHPKRTLQDSQRHLQIEYANKTMINNSKRPVFDRICNKQRKPTKEQRWRPPLRCEPWTLKVPFYYDILCTQRNPGLIKESRGRMSRAVLAIYLHPQCTKKFLLFCRPNPSHTSSFSNDVLMLFRKKEALIGKKQTSCVKCERHKVVGSDLLHHIAH